MIRLDRSRSAGSDRFLYAKLALFFLGAGFFVAGVITGRDWAVAVAIGVLLVALVLRALPGRRQAADDLPRDEGEGGGAEQR